MAVQVVRKHRGRHEILAHVGSAHTDVELGILLERARQFLHGDHGMLDLDVPTPVEQITDVADWRTGQLPGSTTSTRGELAGAGRTVRTSARLLYDVLAFVYDRLGFDIIDDAVFKDLVIARLVEPTSKIDALRVLDDLGTESVSYKTIQRHLARIIAGDYRDRIARRCFEYAAGTGGLGLLLFDVTTGRSPIVGPVVSRAGSSVQSISRSRTPPAGAGGCIRQRTRRGSCTPMPNDGVGDCGRP
ncbi:hypothetical protein [Rhodococcus sp. BUPNP1]|uniref:hypothetical protein n=1 Tax=Rhodococcus sp. BUPNP1 TaxID=1432786 RepID=UPI00117A6C3A|nr:hypothetical protein [Rhodococcus sp. BUPNP1]